MDRFFNFLALFYGCHQKDERCPYIKGKKISLCYRCLGIFFGNIIALSTYFVWFNLYASVIFIFPLIIDGLLQNKTTYTSNNLKRFMSGLLFGYGVIGIFFYLSFFFFNLGKSFNN